MNINLDYEDFFTIEQLRKQCRIDFDDDDDQLIIFCEAALEIVQTHICGIFTKKGQTREEYILENNIIVNDDFYLVEWNKRLHAATLLVTSDLYENRSSNLDYQTYENRAMGLLLSGMVNIQFRGA